MTIIEAIFFGFIQGATEFLPVSSSGHLMLSARLINFEINRAYAVALHLATLGAVIFNYRKTILYLIKNPKDPRVKFVIIACFPTFVLAGLFKFLVPSEIERFLLPVGFTLTIIALLLIDNSSAIIEKHQNRKKNRLLKLQNKESYRDSTLTATENNLHKTKKIKAKQLSSKTQTINETDTSTQNISKKLNLTIKKSLFVGFIQGCAVMSGLSRSGSTICALTFCQTDKSLRGEFSFLLSIPVIIASGLSEIVFATEKLAVDTLPLIVSCLTALLAGILAIKCVLRLIENKKLYIFAIYLIIPLLLSIITM